MSYSYISAGVYKVRGSKWQRLGFRKGDAMVPIPTWVMLLLESAPDDPPIQQGYHFLPHCRGKHFEYLMDERGDFYRRLVRRGSSKRK